MRRRIVFIPAIILIVGLSAFSIGTVGVARAVIEQQQQISLDRENQMNIQSLDRRLNTLEALHVDREQAVLTLGQQVLNEKLATMMNLGLLVLFGVILNLGLTVFRLSLQRRNPQLSADDLK